MRFDDELGELAFDGIRHIGGTRRTTTGYT
jgi:hypothetical protein